MKQGGGQEGTDGGASGSIGAVRTDGVRPGGPVAQGKRRIQVCPHGCVYGDKMAGGDPSQVHHSQGSGRRHVMHF